jgi:RNA polymerase sigma factor (TIGR02999 family)
VSSDGDVTRLIEELSAGKEDAGEALFTAIYEELRALAHRFMLQENPGHTLDTTALVHEAYLRLSAGAGDSLESRAHFLRVAATAMRRVLVDHARRRRAKKRGGDRTRMILDEDTPSPLDHLDVDVIALDDALARLAELDPRMAQIVELRFFSGLTVEDTARVLGVCRRTVATDWRFARVWLAREIGADETR